MDSNRQSARSLSDSSSGSSTHYADIEIASSFDLLSFNNTRKRGSPLRHSSSSTKILAIASLFVSVLCLICVGAFSCWVLLFDGGASPFGFQSSRLEGKGEGTEVCVPCLQVSPDPLDSSSGSAMWDELTVKYDEENDTKICCAVTPKQYAALFKLILQRQQEVQKLADYLEASNETDEAQEDFPVAQQITDTKTPVSAHLVFKPPPQRASVPADADEQTVQHWKSPAESPMSHLQQGLKFHRHTRLLVQTPGLFYVYCQILYSPAAGPAPPSDVTGLQHVTSAYVRRYSILHPWSPEYLLKSRHTRGDAEDRQSSYVGGVVRLYKGDSLYVQVSRPDLISHDDEASFFGMFRVGP